MKFKWVLLMVLAATTLVCAEGQQKAPYGEMFYLYKNSNFGDVHEWVLSPDEGKAQLSIWNDGGLYFVKEAKYKKDDHAKLVQTIDNYFFTLNDSYYSPPAESIVRDDTLFEVLWVHGDQSKTVVTDDRQGPERLLGFIEDVKTKSRDWKDVSLKKYVVQALPIGAAWWRTVYPKKQKDTKSARENFLAREVAHTAKDPVEFKKLDKSLKNAVASPFYYHPLSKASKVLTEEAPLIVTKDDDGNLWLLRLHKVYE
jgi:hypothetical protein